MLCCQTSQCDAFKIKITADAKLAHLIKTIVRITLCCQRVTFFPFKTKIIPKFVQQKSHSKQILK
jgi:hypothetical protein